MSLPDFKTQIKNIRKEALKTGFSISTMDGYLKIWNNFISWKGINSFVYNEKEYIEFLLDYYKFDVNSYTNKSKSHYQQLMRSKRILDDFDTYKNCIAKRVLPSFLYSDYNEKWDEVIDNYLTYCKDICQNKEKTIKVKKDYLLRILSYFYQNNINNLNELKSEHITNFINEVINKGNVSKRRNFYILRDFLNYLFIESILKEDLSIYVPKIRSKDKRKLPTYLSVDDVEKLLDSIPKERKVDIRNYTIILIAARLGLRVSDILNIKLKDIDWINYKLNVIQPKTNNLNILPLSKEVGWAIINYIKNSRPKCNNEYLFVKAKYPFEKMEQFSCFHKYFDKADIEVNEGNEKGIHNLRHSLAKNLLDHDIPIATISSVLGHSNSDITSNTYLKIDIEKLKSCSLEDDE